MVIKNNLGILFQKYTFIKINWHKYTSYQSKKKKNKYLLKFVILIIKKE